MAFAVSDLGTRGYSIGFVVFVFLALLSLAVAWMLKYGTSSVPEAAAAVEPPRPQPRVTLTT
jgi:Na+-transporting methylmalonyl-CoA/oxaloacetate decarboxylase gamma subunit